MPVLAVGAEKAYGPNVAVVMANASHWLMKPSASIHVAPYAQVAVHNAKPPSALHHKLIAFDIANAIAQ